MEVLNFILIIVFFTVSVIGFIKHMYEDCDTPLTSIFFIFTGILCALSILYTITQPTEIDVLDGEAEYVETIHISKGDTIKTYHIQTKESK